MKPNVTRPDWDDAPHWAQFVAQDSDGEWYWFEEKPRLYKWQAWGANGCYEYVETSEPVDYQTSIEARPEWNK